MRERVKKLANTVTAFYYDCVTVEPEAWMPIKEAYALYQEYCEEIGGAPKSQKVFTTNIQECNAYIERKQKRYKKVLTWGLTGLVVQNMTQGVTEPKNPSGYTPILTVRILQDVPPLKGQDGKDYGPFKPEDVVTLPAKNARALISRGAAVEYQGKEVVIKAILSAIRKVEKANGGTTATLKEIRAELPGMSKEDLEEAIEYLKAQGRIYEPRAKKYKVV
jgi:phage/plasmid-associated DNA primase